jgi:hypothetical protein
MNHPDTNPMLLAEPSRPTSPNPDLSEVAEVHALLMARFCNVQTTSWSNVIACWWAVSWHRLSLTVNTQIWNLQENSRRFPCVRRAVKVHLAPLKETEP